MDVDDEEDNLFFEVENIISSRRFGKEIKYRVRWKGYNEADNTWKPFENLKKVIPMVKDFHHINPGALRDPTIML